MSETKEKPRRDYLVEVLRFWACSIVIWHHFFCQFVPRGEFGTEKSWILPDFPGYNVGIHLYKNFFFSIFSGGGFAVSLFFLLSGYILSKPYFHKTTVSWPSLSGDILKRIVRLGFPLYLAGFGACILSKLGFFESYGVVMGRVSGSGWGTAFFPKPGVADYQWPHILMAPFIFTQNLVTPAWTILTELLGSYLSYVMTGIIFASSLGWQIGILTILCAPDYYKFFAIGTLYAYAEARMPDRWRRRWKRIKRFRLSRFFAAGLMAYMLYIAAYPGNNIPSEDVQYTIWAPLVQAHEFCTNFFNLSPGITFIAAIGIFVLAKLWWNDARILRYVAPLGKYTYILYLFHFISLGTFTSWFYLTIFNRPGIDPVPGILATAAFYVFTLVVCCFFEPHIDARAIKWSHQVKSLYLRSLTTNETPIVNPAPTLQESKK